MKIKTRFYAGGFPLEVPLGTRGVCRMREHGNLWCILNETSRVDASIFITAIFS